MDCGKDDFVLSSVGIVVAHEEQLIRRVGTLASSYEAVAAVDNLFGIVLGILPAGSTSVHLGIQIDTGKKHLGSNLVGTSVGGACFRQHVGTLSLSDDSLELALNKVENLGTSVLWSRLDRNGCHKRHVSEEVHQIRVVQGAHETSLGTLL